MNRCCCEVELMGNTPALIRPPLTAASRRLGHHVVFILLTAPDGRCCSPHFPQFLRVTSDSERLKNRVLSQEEGDRQCAAWRVREAGNDPTTTLEAMRRIKLRDIARNPQRNLNPLTLGGATSDMHPFAEPQTSVFVNPSEYSQQVRSNAHNVN
jgi:hypothetical protein